MRQLIGTQLDYDLTRVAALALVGNSGFIAFGLTIKGLTYVQVEHDHTPMSTTPLRR